MFGVCASVVTDSVQEVILASGADFNLKAHLDVLGITDGKVNVIIPAGVIIGGTVSSVSAFTVGDISAFDEVVIDVLGEIQGKGGVGSGGVAGHGLFSEHPVTLNITGNVRGGGGGGARGSTGGVGGTGGAGNNISGTSGYQYSDNSPKYMWANLVDPGYPSYWADAAIVSMVGTINVDGAVVYEKGATINGFFCEIRRSNLVNGVAGTGGNGGAGGSGSNGVGFNQARGGNNPGASGIAGGGGTNRAGAGGRGGDGSVGGQGGDWGAIGATPTAPGGIGNPGVTGHSYVDNNASQANNGTGGANPGGYGSVGAGGNHINVPAESVINYIN